MEEPKEITAIDCLNKTIMNYEIIITSIYNQLTVVQARMAYYKDFKAKRCKRIYQTAFVREQKLLRFLEAMRKGQHICREQIKEILEFYPNEGHKKIWYMHFIEKKKASEIAEETNYTVQYIKNIITGFRKDLIELEFLEQK